MWRIETSPTCRRSAKVRIRACLLQIRGFRGRGLVNWPSDHAAWYEIGWGGMVGVGTRLAPDWLRCGHRLPGILWCYHPGAAPNPAKWNQLTLPGATCLQSLKSFLERSQRLADPGLHRPNRQAFALCDLAMAPALIEARSTSSRCPAGSALQPVGDGAFS